MNTVQLRLSSGLFFCVLKIPSPTQWRGHSVCRKRYRFCTNCTKSLGELLCPKRSTGTFWRVSLLGYVKRGGGLVRLPSKCFRISHPLLRFFEAKGDFAVCGQRRGAPPLDPATFEKVDETFTFVFICATFFILLLFQQAECPLQHCGEGIFISTSTFSDFCPT